jgi:hypothetical protein
MKRLLSKTGNLLLVLVIVVLGSAFFLTLRNTLENSSVNVGYPGPQQQVNNAYPGPSTNHDQGNNYYDSTPLPRRLEDPVTPYQLPTALPYRGVGVATPIEIDLSTVILQKINTPIQRLFAPDLDRDLLVAKAVAKEGIFIAVIDLAAGQVKQLIPMMVRDSEGPYIADNYVVWTELTPEVRDNMKRIQLLDMETGLVRTVFQGNLHQLNIKDGLIVWQEYRGTGWEIYGYDLQQERELTVARGEGVFSWPRVCSRDWIIYMRYPRQAISNQLSSADLYAHNLESGQQILVGQVPLSSSPTTGRSHDCDGKRIAWASFTIDGQGEKSVAKQHIFDLAIRIEHILPIPMEGWGIHVQISGDILISTVGYDLERNIAFDLFPENLPLEQRGNVMISGGRLAWVTGQQDPINDPWHVYTTTIIRE